MNDKPVSDDRITKEEFDVWVHNPITQLIHAFLTQEVATLLDMLLHNSHSADSQNRLMLDGEYKGRINASTAVLNINYPMIKNLLDQEGASNG